MSETMQKREYDRTSSVLLMLMLAAGMCNVAGKGSYILLGTGAAFFLAHYYRIKVPASVFSMLVFACVYCGFTIGSMGIVSSVQMLLCPVLWLLGYNLPEARRKNGVFLIMAVLAMGMASHGLLNYAYNTIKGVNMYGGTKLDIWTGAGQAATGQAANFSMFLGMLFWFLFVQEKRWLRRLTVVLFLLAFLYAVMLGSRTFMVLCAITLTAVSVAYFSQRGHRKQGLKLLVAVLLGIAVFAVFYSNNVLGLRDYIENSYLFRRIRIGENFEAMVTDGRFRLKRMYLQNLFRHPWGGGYIRANIAGKFAHDLWLDIFDEAGIFSLITLLMYTGASIYRLFAVGRAAGLSRSERTAIFCYGITMFAQFAAEPIWQGMPMLFYAFVLTDGMMAKLLSVSAWNMRGK